MGFVSEKGEKAQAISGLYRYRAFTSSHCTVGMLQVGADLALQTVLTGVHAAHFLCDESSHGTTSSRQCNGSSL